MATRLAAGAAYSASGFNCKMRRQTVDTIVAQAGRSYAKFVMYENNCT